MISSAMISAEFLKENIHPGLKVAYLGRETSAYFIREADLIPVKIEALEEKEYEELGEYGGGSDGLLLGKSGLLTQNLGLDSGGIYYWCVTAVPDSDGRGGDYWL